MAIVDLNEIGLFTSIRKKLMRDITIYPEKPHKGGGFAVILENGIYQMVRYNYGFVCRRIDFYEYVITHTEAQQERREKFADAVAGWQNLTAEQKLLYNKRSIGKHMSGYNLYIKEFMHG